MIRAALHQRANGVFQLILHGRGKRKENITYRGVGLGGGGAGEVHARRSLDAHAHRRLGSKRDGTLSKHGCGPAPPEGLFGSSKLRGPTEIRDPSPT
jgi:hypothetical protein